MTPERRWLEDGAPPEVSRLLESTVIDEPTLEQLQSLRTKLGPLLNTPPGAPAGAPSGAGATAGVAGKVITAMVLLGLVGAVGVWFSRPTVVASQPIQVAPPLATNVAPALEPAIETPPANDVEVTAPAERLAPAAKVARVRPILPEVAAKPAPAAASTDDELELLQSAMSASPAEALTLVEQHLARFPQSSLAQERELLAVQALTTLGRHADAEARAAAFKERWPTSAHLLRLDALVK